MRTLNSKKSYLFLAFFLLGLSYLIPTLYKDELTFKKEIPETNTRRNLLNKKVKKNLYRQFIPVDSSLYSHYLYDFLIKSDFDGNFPNSDKLIPNINGVYSSSWRIKFTEPGDLYYEIPKNYKNFDLYITDVNGLPIYRSSEMINLPDNYIKIKPGIYKFKLNSQDKLSKFKFNFES